ncbi:hypothetical protein PTI98_007230 [Pleurotus ostreatus]|nr:hypothetical protein PTI98_007230 [Pleurotus ostreatus]
MLSAFTGERYAAGEPVSSSHIKGIKEFFIGQRIFEEKREREMLEAAGEAVDSDDEKTTDWTGNGREEEMPSTSSSPWDEPLSPLSSLPPSPTLPEAPLGVLPDVGLQDEEREAKVKELTAKWSGIKDARRRAKRLYKRQQNAQDAEPHTLTKGVAKRHRQRSTVMKTELRAPDLPVASTGWVGLRDRDPQETLYTVKQLIEGKGFKLVDWDGRTSIPIADSGGSIVSALLGQPADPGWKDAIDDATEAILQASSEECFHQEGNRRGPFSTAPIGISYGGGQKKPGNLLEGGPEVQRLLGLLIKNKGIRRLAGFAASGFATYAPKTYDYYHRTMEALLAGHPQLRRNFKNSPWACTSFNMGPQTVCYPHVDSGNLPWGWCAVTALGNFNPDHGGHLVLWDLGLVIRFPPGATVLIPSAVMKHSNTLIGEGESRYSFTQYSAGGLFRWVENGLASDKQRDAEASRDHEMMLERQSSRATRWQRGLSMFSTILDFWPQKSSNKT